jgi:hypothetical protein
MSDKAIPQDYANGLIFELEKAFWDERGRGARFRTTNVGREYFRERCLPGIQAGEMDAILGALKDILQRDGVVEEIAFTREERLLRVRVQGCIHRLVEDKLIESGVEPFTCVPANLIALAIEENLDRPVELAEIRVEGEACHLLLVVFEARPTLE